MPWEERLKDYIGLEEEQPALAIHRPGWFPFNAYIYHCIYKLQLYYILFSFFFFFIDIVSGEMKAYYMVIWHKSDLNHLNSICLPYFHWNWESCSNIFWIPITTHVLRHYMHTYTESCCNTVSTLPHILLYCRLFLNFQVLSSHTIVAISEHENILINTFSYYCMFLDLKAKNYALFQHSVDLH